jgi:Spy/CpxP family protein refolding chaperone
MKRTVITAALLSTFIALPAFAQQGPGMYGGMMGGGAMMGGPGMMGGQGAGNFDCHDGYAALNLTSEQRAKIADIQRELWRKRQEIMSRGHQRGAYMRDPLALASLDEAAARKSFDAMSAAMKQMFDASLDAGKRINAVLTDEQRSQLKQIRP